MSKEVKITVIEPHEMGYDYENDVQFKDPAAWYIVNALDQRIYLHVRSRQDAVDWVKENYDGRYTVRSAKLHQKGGDITCRGTNTRKGQFRG